MSEIRPYQDFRVLLRVVKEVEFIVQARTSEQAEGLAEELVAEGETGQEMTSEIEVLEAYPDDSHSDATGHF